MNIHPCTIPEALEYMQKAPLMPIDGELSLGHVTMLSEHLEHAVSCGIALSEQLHNAEEALVKYMALCEEQSAAIAAFLANPSPMEAVGPPASDIGPKQMYDPDLDQWYTLDSQGYWQAEAFPDTTVEFRTDAETMDRHQPEIVRDLAAEIVREFGGQTEIDPDCKHCKRFQRIGRIGCTTHYPLTQRG